MANYTTTEKEVLWKLVKRSNPKFDVPLVMFNYTATPLPGDGTRNTSFSIKDLQTGSPIVLFYDRLNISDALGFGTSDITTPVANEAAARAAVLAEFDTRITRAKLKVDPTATPTTTVEGKKVTTVFTCDASSMLFVGSVTISAVFN